MKTKILILLLSACCLLSCTDSLWNAIEDLNKKYENLDDRVARLEELCKEMNTNIASLQTLVQVMLGNDYIVSITPVMKDGQEIGFVITFAIHDPITIYHGRDGQNGLDGKDGKDGKDGADGQDGQPGNDGLNGQDGKDGKDGRDGIDGRDGQDGAVPVIGVALDETDGAYYWTLNGTWLLDANGNRIPLTSRDGRDGQDGADGQDGQDGRDGRDGRDGADGITPQLKIENGYWYVSTDNGTTWTQLGRATGETGAAGRDGRDGRDGADGQDGDSMFQSVTQDENFVYLVLANGTTLRIPKYIDPDKVQIVDGAIIAEFSVSDSTKVYFSMGNLEYLNTGSHLCADGTMKPGSWCFVDNQWELGSPLYWGDTGFRDTVHSSESDYLSFYINNMTALSQNIENTYYDWGKYNTIENGGNNIGAFRTLTEDEWTYLLKTRPNAEQLKGFLHIYGEDETFGYLLPDDWDTNIQIPETLYLTPQLFGEFPEWNILGDKGVILLPVSNTIHGYYTSTYHELRHPYASVYDSYCYQVNISASFFTISSSRVATWGSYGTNAEKYLVRLVRNVE